VKPYLIPFSQNKVSDPITFSRQGLTDTSRATFKAVRWSDNGGQPYCSKCGCTAIYQHTARRIFKCKGCEAQFSATSGTIFASRKLAL